MILIIIGVLLIVLSGSLYTVLKLHVEAQAERETFEKIMRASEPPRADGYPVKRIS